MRLTESLNTDEINNDELVRLLMLPDENENADNKAAEGAECNNKENEGEAEDGDDAVTVDDQISVSSHIASRRTRITLVYPSAYKFTVKEISETIPEYDPTTGQTMCAEHFVEHVDSAIRAYGFDTKCLLLAVYSRLKGVARLWLDGQRKLFTSWEEFKVELLGEFGQELDEAEVNNIMSKTVRRTEENLADYCFKMQALGKRYGLSESAIIKYTRNGLRHRELQNAIAIVKFHSMRDMRKTLEEYENNVVRVPRHANESRPNKREPNRQAYDRANANVVPRIGPFAIIATRRGTFPITVASRNGKTHAPYA